MSGAQRATRAVDTPDGVTIDGAPRIAVNKTEAAQLLGVSVDFFDEHIAAELRVVRRGRRRLYAVAALQSWLEREGESISG